METGSSRRSSRAMSRNRNRTPKDEALEKLKNDIFMIFRFS